MYIDVHVHTCMYTYDYDLQVFIMNLAIKTIQSKGLTSLQKPVMNVILPLPPTLHMLFSHGHTGYKQAVS